MSEERRAQFVADVGDKFLARALELFQAGQIVEDHNRSLVFPSPSKMAAALIWSHRSESPPSFNS